MLNKIDHTKMGSSNLGWLRSLFHFSFAEYYNPQNMHFGVLRVINDDLIAAHTGFDTHPHRDMEIVSYVVEGQLTHGDSMGNKNTIQRGHVQYMSAGTGVLHSEHNHQDNTARFLQIWIMPDQKGLKPNYGDYRFSEEDRQNKWNLLVSGQSGEAPIRISQDARIFVAELTPNGALDFPLAPGRQAYLVQIEGTSTINGLHMDTRDALETNGALHIVADENRSHFLVVEMKSQP